MMAVRRLSAPPLHPVIVVKLILCVRLPVAHQLGHGNVEGKGHVGTLGIL